MVIFMKVLAVIFAVIGAGFLLDCLFTNSILSGLVFIGFMVVSMSFAVYSKLSQIFKK
jgi:hypothetical protein